jgi:hypothetical protein
MSFIQSRDRACGFQSNAPHHPPAKPVGCMRLFGGFIAGVLPDSWKGRPYVNERLDNIVRQPAA